MTTIVTERAISLSRYDPLAALPTAIGLIAIMLFISLLIQKEFYRAQGGRWEHTARTLDTIIAPLGLAVIYIIVLRALNIIGAL
jgi:hypothetical protein